MVLSVVADFVETAVKARVRAVTNSNILRRDPSRPAREWLNAGIAREKSPRLGSLGVRARSPQTGESECPGGAGTRQAQRC